MAGGDRKKNDPLRYRIEGVVPTQADRDRIKAAADERGMSVVRFIGEASMVHADRDRYIARLETLAGRQETVLSDLAGLSEMGRELIGGMAAMLAKVDALLTPVRHTCEIVERGQGTLSTIHGRIKCPEAMTTIMATSEQVKLLAEAMGVKVVPTPVLDDYENRQTSPTEEADKLGGPGKGKLDNGDHQE